MKNDMLRRLIAFHESVVLHTYLWEQEPDLDCQFQTLMKMPSLRLRAETVCLQGVSMIENIYESAKM